MMVRPRKSALKQPSNNGTSSSSSNSDTTESNFISFPKLAANWKTLVCVLCCIIAVYVGSLGYLETRVNTPFVDEKILTPETSGLGVPELYWGSYRPGVYFGMKSREPRSPVYGLMWYSPAHGHKGVRHWCEQGDDLARYGWLKHDGVSFGEQVIEDSPHVLTTSFLKTPGGEHGGHWTARVHVRNQLNDSTPFALLWYGALDAAGGAPAHTRLWLEGGALLGHTPNLNNFKVELVPVKGQGKVHHTSYTEAHAAGLDTLKETVFSLLRAERHAALGRHAALVQDPQLTDKNKEVNFVAVHLLVETPFAVDIVYTTEDLPAPSLKGAHYARELEARKDFFDLEFEDKFKLKAKGYPPKDIAAAQAALSNMLGGIGFFYGAGRVQSQYTKEPVPYWRAPLFTAVPSRSFFPRGFLWDEGFHGLLLGRWAPSLQLDIAAHWLDLINVEGWIPREQILGPEALARVPKEFVVQSNAAANPPMLLVQLGRLVGGRPDLFAPGRPMRQRLERMYSRLQAWYQWFLWTQKGDAQATFRWRGRDDNGLELNPKTLTSGLDDYPRASHPSDIERHVDLRCWMFAASEAMVAIAQTLERECDKYEQLRDLLGSEKLLNEQHWSESTKTYADYGLHTDGVRLVRQSAKSVKQGEQPKVVRLVSTPPQPRLVTSAFGYVSLFPMLLRVLKPGSPKLGKILEDLDRPELLWSDYGLRSLSKTSPLYMKRNTEHDQPYWRGQVWVNVNYLALAALKHYAGEEGPYRERAGQLHVRLRANLVGNILSEYHRTGYYWEQYSGEDGKGSGCRPFTGWTALVVLIMAEDY